MTKMPILRLINTNTGFLITLQNHLKDRSSLFITRNKRKALFMYLNQQTHSKTVSQTESLI